MIDNPNDLTEQVQNLAERTAQVASDHLARILALTTDFEEFKKTASGRTLKQLVWTALPVNDAGLHLVDGSELYAGGVYDGFVTDVARLESSYPDAFVTQEQWDDSVNTYGACGKFVVRRNGGSVVSVRLPKVSDILQGTTDLSAVGDLVEAGLPNITGSFSPNGSTGVGATAKQSGAFKLGSQLSSNCVNYQSQTGYYEEFDASRSSPYYSDDVDKPTPQTIKALLYICVATSVKTDVEVDIDEVITDLNNKLDNSDNYGVTPKIDSQKIVSGEFIATNITIANEVKVPTTSAIEYSLANHLPNDGYVYEAMFAFLVKTDTSSGNYVALKCSTDLCSGQATVATVITRENYSLIDGNTSWLPVGAGRKLIVNPSSTSKGAFNITLYGYRRLYKA